MRIDLSAIFGLLLAILFLCPSNSQATTLGSSFSRLNGVVVLPNVAKTADHYGYYYRQRRHRCYYVYKRCHRRYRYGSEYEYCMRRNGCRQETYPERYNVCFTWHKKCVRQWGYDRPNYSGCMRFHNCGHYRGPVLRRYPRRRHHHHHHRHRHRYSDPYDRYFRR